MSEIHTPRRRDGTTVSFELFAACLVMCSENEQDPFQVDTVVVHTMQPSNSKHGDREIMPGVFVTPAVHVIPAEKECYRWEQWIPEITRFHQLWKACNASKLFGTPNQ